MNISEQIRLAYPMPIAKLYNRMQLQSDPILRVQAMVTLVEGIVRYFALICLATYTEFQLTATKVEDSRLGLLQPSFGHWLGLFNNTAIALENYDIPIIIPGIDHQYENDPILEASQKVSQITGLRYGFQKVSLKEFLEKILTFRNLKIGHNLDDPLTLGEANLVKNSLEIAINQWLSEQQLLQEKQLVYISSSIWEGDFFTYQGRNLNCGLSLTLFEANGLGKIFPDRVYLFTPDNSSFLTLYPYFCFDQSTEVLFIFNRIDKKKKVLILKSDTIGYGAKKEQKFEISPSEILGSGSPPEEKGKEEIVENDPATSEERNSYISPYEEIIDSVKANLNEMWLTDSQLDVWSKINKFLEPPFYVINIFGETGSGKTFIGWLLEKQKQARYVNTEDISWENLKDSNLIIVDGYDPSRRSVRSLRGLLLQWNIEQAIILTQRKAQDDIPCIHLNVTRKDIQIVKATLYRELDQVVPDVKLYNLWDCYKHLAR